MSARWRIDVGAVFVYVALGALFSAVPRYVVEDLGGDRGTAGFAVSVFFLGALVARPFAGRFVDRRGRRPLLATLPFVIAAIMLGFLVAGSVPVVLGLRFVQGLAGGALYVAAVTAETDLAGPAHRAAAVARLSIAIYVGFAAGPALGEWLTDLGGAATWLVLAAVPAVGGLLLGTVPETRPDPAAPGAHELPAAGSATGAVIEDPEPTVAPGAPLIHPTAVLPGLTLLTLGVGYTTVTGLSALYARTIGMSSSEVLYASFAVTILLVRLGSGRLADRIGPMRVAFPGMGAYVAGFALLSQVPEPVAAAVGVALVGLGWALVFPAVIAWLTEQVPDAQRGAALGTLIGLMDVGQGTGGYLVGSVADGLGYRWALAVPGALAVVGTAVLVAAVRRADHRADRRSLT